MQPTNLCTETMRVIVAVIFLSLLLRISLAEETQRSGRVRSANSGSSISEYAAPRGRACGTGAQSRREIAVCRVEPQQHAGRDRFGVGRIAARNSRRQCAV